MGSMATTGECICGRHVAASSPLSGRPFRRRREVVRQPFNDVNGSITLFVSQVPMLPNKCNHRTAGLPKLLGCDSHTTMLPFFRARRISDTPSLGCSKESRSRLLPLVRGTHAEHLIKLLTRKCGRIASSITRKTRGHFSECP